MTDIKVILNTGTNVNIDLLTNEEILTLFDGIAKENLDINKGIFDSFALMNIDYNAKKILIEKPTLNELLLRQIVSLSDENLMIIPITKVLPNIKLGGYKIKFQSKQESTEGIKIKFDTNTLCIAGENTYLSPKNEEVSVTNLLVFSPIQKLNLSNYEKFQKSIIRKKPITDNLLVGNFRYFDLAKLNPYFVVPNAKIYDLNNLSSLFDYIISIKLSYFDMGTALMSFVNYTKLYLKPQLKPIPIYSEEISKSPILLLIESFDKIKFSNYPLNDLDKQGMLKVYYDAEIRGIDSEQVKDFISLYKSRDTKQKFQQKLKLNAIERENKFNFIMAIIEKKLGTARANAILKLRKNNEDIMGLLKNEEKKQIEMEYNRKITYLEAVLNNKCKHVQLYKKYRAARDINSEKKFFNELKEFFKPTKNMTVCNVCGFEFICPHVIKLTELTLSRKSTNEIKAQLTPFIDTAYVKDQFYCKICGEIISNNEAFDETMELNNDIMDEELKNFIWGEVTGMSKYLKGSTDINTINKIIEVIYPYIADIERQIIKSKTNTSDEIKAKKRLYINIYTSAYIVHLVISTINKSPQFVFSNNPIKNKRTALVDCITYAISIVMTRCAVIMRLISGATPELIKRKVIEAYKSLQNNKVDIKEKPKDDIMDILVLDPVYNYIYSMYVQNELFENRKITTTVLEKSKESIFGNPFNNFSNRHWKNFKFIVNSYKTFIAGVVNRLCTIPLYNVSGSITPEHEKQISALIDLQNVENKMIKSSRQEKMQPFVIIGKKSAQFVNPNASLGRIYDINGNPHIWNIYVTKDKEFKLSEYNGVIIDKKCSVCNQLLSTCGEIDEKIIIDNLNKKNKINNFYLFYENRCPEGDLHQFKNDICNKCGFNASQRDDTYYDKYKDSYIKSKIIINDKLLSKDPFIVYSDVLEKFSNLSTYVFNFNVILELSSSININHRLIFALGASEKIEYADIVNGKYIPGEAETRYDTRIYKIVTIIKNLITEYNQLKNFHKIFKPPISLSLLFDSSGILRSNMSELGKKMPEIYDNFNDKFTYIQTIKKPREIVEFLLEELCKMCLLILNDNVTETSKLRINFVKYFIDKILNNDKMLTKYGYFSWSILYGDKEQKEKNENNSDDESPIVEDDEAAMNLDAFDVEDDEDVDMIRVEGFGF
jgi:hypothetical protein